MPYGMPSGAGLRSLICRGGSHLAATLHEKHHINKHETVDFVENFSRSNVASIDAFLSRHERFFAIGKLCIAETLCSEEDPAKVLNNDTEDHWYHHMWQILIDGADTANDLLRNKIKFVTFNYDRSLEYFLHQSTKYTYGVSDEVALTVVNSLNILHVYGLLGKFSYLSSQGSRQYAGNNTPEQISFAANSINVIPETREDNEAFETARNWLGNSEIIGFLGFGFDALNVKRIGLNSIMDRFANQGKSNPTIIASTYGKTPAETNKIRQLLWPNCPDKYMHTLNFESTKAIRNSDLLG